MEVYLQCIPHKSHRCKYTYKFWGVSVVFRDKLQFFVVNQTSALDRELFNKKGEEITMLVSPYILYLRRACGF